MERRLSPVSTESLKLPPLTGIRFFAVFHIFLFHLWTLHDMEKPEGLENLMGGFEKLPDVLVNFLANGWMSTSFFFLLSGFILSYLYWSPGGGLSVPRKRFWLTRFSRLYPIHIIVLLLTAVLLVPYYIEQDLAVSRIILSGLATLTLMQSWIPAWVPMWSWPTWALSALVFLYLLMPWLMKVLAKLNRRQMILLLAVMPIISMLPTAVYAVFFPPGTEASEEWKIFLGSTPIFWVPHFAAGMLLSRIFAISRYSSVSADSSGRRFAWGDAALVTVIAVACLPGIEEPFKFFLRHGLVMPLYMVIVVDLARGNGLAARIFSLPGMGFLGETGFSIFIWQNMVMMACYIVLLINPAWGGSQLLWASVAMLPLAIISTYYVEKPLAKKLRKRWLGDEEVTNASGQAAVKEA